MSLVVLDLVSEYRILKIKKGIQTISDFLILSSMKHNARLEEKNKILNSGILTLFLW